MRNTGRDGRWKHWGAALLLLAPLLVSANEGEPLARERRAAPLPVLLDVLEQLPPGAREGGELRASGGPLTESLMRPDARSPELRRIEVEYTLDAGLQRRVQRVLEVGRVSLGHVIVLDPRDGRVLAYVSTNPVAFPATRRYPTASLMKLVTATAVLRHAPEAVERPCRYAGSPYVISPARLELPARGGRVDSFWRALAISNNQCFGRLAVHDVGAERLVDEMGRLGLLEAPAPGHPAGRLDPLENDLELGELGSGLAGSFITPLAAARLVAALAEGSLVQPHWVAGVRDIDGRPLELPGPLPPRPVLAPEDAAELRELLVGITQRGTARSAFRDERGRYLLGPVRVAGKTGSLSGRDPDGRYEWFVGLAPAEDPDLAVAAVVVNGALWWRNAAQIAAEVLRGIFCSDGSCDPAAAESLLAAGRRRDRKLPAVGAPPPGVALP